MKSDDDDMKLTAYALGELREDDSDRAAVEARVENDAAARAEVEQIRGIAELLTRQLASEPLPAVEPVDESKLRPRPRWGARLAIAAMVSIVVGGLAVSVMLPSLNRAREVADRVSSASNLRQIGQAPALAPSDNRGVYPQQNTLPYVGAAPAPAAPAQQPNALFRARRQPIAPSFNLQRQTQTNGSSLFGGMTGGLSQSYQNPYPGTQGAGAGFKLDNQFGAEFAVAADVEPGQAFNTETYDRIVDNPFLTVSQNPLSTFSIDVDTASYSNVRRFLSQGQRPPKDAVRIEELINYFPYDYPPPGGEDADKPFATHVEVAECPWQPEHRLVRVGIKGKEIAADERPASNLVFLLDVSGSMQPANKLPLVKRAMRMLLEQLDAEDRVAIAVYAGTSGLVLPATACDDAGKQSILHALEHMEAGGSTNGAQGIQLAYAVAQQNFIEGGTNRVILCTDGDFNVGITNQGDLTRLIEEKAKGGVFLSVLGFGMGNLKDSTMEKLADKGNGNYAYIDTLSEARKVLVEQMSGTLVTIAKDVKIQVEFNPAVVGSYRLIGYENRLLAKEDFNDDTKDAGEIGAGHAVTALYEVVPAGQAPPPPPPTTPPVDALKYQAPATIVAAGGPSGEMLTLKLRYKEPDGQTSRLIETPVTDNGGTFARASADFKFASAVAAFGMILRDSPHKGSADLPAVLEWAQDGTGADRTGYRREFLDLVKEARAVIGR